MKIVPQSPRGWLATAAIAALASQVLLDGAGARVVMCAVALALFAVSALMRRGRGAGIGREAAAGADARPRDQCSELMAVLSQSSFASLLVVDGSGRVMAASEAARTMLGAGDEVLGVPVETLLTGTTKPMPSWPWPQEHLEATPVGAGARKLWVESRAWPEDPAGRRVVVLVDRTEAEEAMRAAEAARDEALRAAQVRAEFLANISHEIRTPMNGVLGMLALLREEMLEPEQLELVDHTHRSATALLGIVNDLLDISRLTSGAHAPLEAVEFDVLTLVEDVCVLLYDTRRDPRVSLVISAEAGLERRVVGDAGRLRQVVNNLVSNAIKFTRRGHVVARVGTQRDADGGVILTVSVEDTGIGIARENLEVIFERFRQVDGSMSRRYGGAGLGLAIARELARNMKGEIAVTSEPGTGSVFSFSCRLAPGVAVKGPDLSGRRVLIATLASAEGEALADNLSGHGATCRTAHSTEELVRGLGDADVLVADSALVTDARRRGTAIAVPLVLLSTAQEAAREDGGDRKGLRLAKPVRVSRAAEVVLAAVREAPEGLVAAVGPR